MRTILRPQSGVSYSGVLGGSADRCRSEACGRCADTIRTTALGRTTLIVPRAAQPAFVCIRLETALTGTTRSTTGLHPTLDWFDRNSTAFVRASTREQRPKRDSCMIDGRPTGWRLAAPPR